VLQGRPFGPFFQGGGDFCPVKGEFASHFHQVDGKPGVLADEHILLVRHLHVAENGLENLFGRGLSFLGGGLFQGFAHIRGRIFRPGCKVLWPFLLLICNQTGHFLPPSFGAALSLRRSEKTDILHDAVPHVTDVLPHPAFRHLGTSLAECLEEVPVFIEGSLHPAGHPHGGETKNPDVVVQGGDKADEALRLGELNDSLMEFKILSGVSADFFSSNGSAKPRLQIPVWPDLFRSSWWPPTGRQAFEVLPDQEKLVNILFRELDDVSPLWGMISPVLLFPGG